MQLTIAQSEVEASTHQNDLSLFLHTQVGREKATASKNSAFSDNGALGMVTMTSQLSALGFT